MQVKQFLLIIISKAIKDLYNDTSGHITETLSKPSIFKGVTSVSLLGCIDLLAFLLSEALLFQKYYNLL
jgi:hypothetical protein